MNRNQSEVLKRELGLFGAVMMGLGSIVGTGVFVSIGIGAGITGPSVILAIAVAAMVATCNALSSAQLAASHPVSGGTYEYGYRYLSPLLGFSAGWMFLSAKCSSAATAALGFSGYLLQSFDSSDNATVAVAVITAIVVTMVVLSGLRRTNLTNIAIVSVTLSALAVFVLCGLPPAVSNGSQNFSPFFDSDEYGAVQGFLFATALMFVAFTGYGRIATLGEEVRQPKQTIPRAIIITLVISSVLYIAVGAVAIGVLGSAEFSNSAFDNKAPLEVAARKFDIPLIHRLVGIGAMTAMLGVLLNLVLGLSRVLLAMGRRRDMPSVTARVNRSSRTPTVAVIVVGGMITALCLIGNVKTTWSFSAFTVLIYYAITNMAALRLPPDSRLYPPALAWVGLSACLFLAFWVDWQVWLSGLALLGAGLVWHATARRLTKDAAK